MSDPLDQLVAALAARAPNPGAALPALTAAAQRVRDADPAGLDQAVRSWRTTLASVAAGAGAGTQAQAERLADQALQLPRSLGARPSLVDPSTPVIVRPRVVSAGASRGIEL